MGVLRELFSVSDVSDSCADQRSRFRGYKDCLLHGSEFLSTAVFLPPFPLYFAM